MAAIGELVWGEDDSMTVYGVHEVSGPILCLGPSLICSMAGNSITYVVFKFQEQRWLCGLGKFFLLVGIYKFGLVCTLAVIIIQNYKCWLDIPNSKIH